MALTLVRNLFTWLFTNNECLFNFGFNLFADVVFYAIFYTDFMYKGKRFF